MGIGVHKPRVLVYTTLVTKEEVRDPTASPRKPEQEEEKCWTASGAARQGKEEIAIFGN